MSPHNRGRSTKVSPVAIARQASLPIHVPSLSDRSYVCGFDDDDDDDDVATPDRSQAQLRVDRLRACEDENRRLPREPLLFPRAREKQRQREQLDALELQRMRYQSRLRSASPRGLLSYTSLPHLPTPHSSPTAYANEPFQYHFMVPSTSRSSTTRPRPRPTSPPSPQLTYGSNSNNTVLFKDVLASMHGTLFPPDTAFPSTRASTVHLDCLLEPVQRNHTKLTPDKESIPSHRSVRLDAARCAACSASIAKVNSVSTSPSSTGAHSSPSRSDSWLSFGTRASTSTAATTPSTSPICSWLYFAPVKATAPIKSFQYRHSCHSSLTPIDIADTPLDLGIPKRQPTRLDRNQDGLRPDPNNIRARPKSLVFNVAGSMSCVLDLAKGLHITTTLFSISFDARMSSPPLPLPPHDKLSVIPKPNLKPPGWRVSPTAAAIFAVSSSEESDEEPASPPPHFIPLLSTRDKHRYTLCLSPSTSSQHSGSTDVTLPFLRTVLPNPPPPVFPPPPLLPRSPLRPRDPPPAGSIVLRVRPVANPALLRLRALQNVLDERGVGWEGKAKEGGLGAGRERLCRVAFEGLGRSALACEVGQCVV